jgi:hypothetical protein
MDSTYNPHKDTGGAWGHGIEEIYSNGKHFKRRTSMFTYDGCQMILRAKDDPTAPLYSDLYTTRIYNFNLRDIDPNSVKIYSYDPQYGGLSCDFDRGDMICSVGEIEFQTRNQEPLIDEDLHIVYPTLKGTEHDAKDKTKTFVWAFYMDDIEYAKRFAKAFRHVIALCGGKPSVF